MLIATAHREAEHSRAASQMQEGRGGRERQPGFSSFPHSNDAVLQCTLSVIHIPLRLAKFALHGERLLRIRRVFDTHLSRLWKD